MWVHRGKQRVVDKAAAVAWLSDTVQCVKAPMRSIICITEVCCVYFVGQRGALVCCMDGLVVLDGWVSSVGWMG